MPSIPIPAFLAPLMRSLARRPASTLLAILMLSLGIGASTAVFSLMAPMLLRPMGIPDSDRVIQVFRTVKGETQGVTFRFEKGLPSEELLAHQANNPSILAVANASVDRFVVRAEGQDARYSHGSFIDSGYFKVMGISPWLGRAFTTEEDKIAEPSVLISYSLWTKLYGAERNAIGRVLHVDGKPYRVIGVFPRHFTGHNIRQGMDLWLPMGIKSRTAAAEPAAGSFSSSEPTLARLGRGVTLLQAEAAFQAIGSGFQAALQLPGTTVSPISLRPFGAGHASVLEDHLPAPWLLLSVAGGLLLLACANVANLRLAQLESRRQEFATRLALGARRGVLLRSVLAENLALSALAGLLGLALAPPIMQGLQAIRDVKIYETPTPATLSIHAFLFAMLLVLFTSLAVGILPALQTTRVQLAHVLKETTATLTHGSRLKDALVVLQVALALVLITGGTLVTRGLDRAKGEALGYRVAGVAGLRMEFPESWPKARRGEALQSLNDRIAALPGVRSVSWAEGLPMEEGSQTITMLQGKACRLLRVGPGYFSTVGLSMVRGREFESSDLVTDGRVVNQSLAQLLWPGQDPLGQDLKGHPVVGVVADHGVSQEEDIHKPVLFAPMKPEGHHTRAACLLLRTEGSPEPLFPTARKWVQAIDPDLPLLQVTTLEAHLDRLHHHLRVASWLLGFCGIASLILSAMGVQSLLIFQVARQARETGLRMALGADQGRILRQVIMRGMRSVLAGLLLGGLGAFWLGRAFHHWFPGINPLEPSSLLTAFLVLMSASFLACLLPALRAASLDPARTLRQE